MNAYQGIRPKAIPRHHIDDAPKPSQAVEMRNTKCTSPNAPLLHLDRFEREHKGRTLFDESRPLRAGPQYANLILHDWQQFLLHRNDSNAANNGATSSRLSNSEWQGLERFITSFVACRDAYDTALDEEEQEDAQRASRKVYSNSLQQFVL